MTSCKTCAHGMRSVKPRSTHSCFHHRPVLLFALSQIVRRDRAERSGIAGEPGRCVGKGVWTLEPKATRRKGTEQQGTAQVRPVLQARLDARRPGEGQGHKVHPGLL